jgi:uncharacterized membrane protein
MSEQQNLLTPNLTQKNNLPNATAAIVLGILSILGGFCYGIFGIVFGIVGLVLANKDLSLYKANPENYAASSFSNAKAGRVCSIIGLIIGVLVIVSIAIFIAFYGTAFMEEFKKASEANRK